MAKIIGNTTATPNPQADWNQTDSTKADYIKNKPVIADNNTTYTLTKEDNKIYLRGSDGSEMFVIDSSADAGNNTTYQLIEEGNKHILVGSDGSRTEVIDHGAEYVELVQSDWNQDDDTKADYIKNKPELGELALKSEVTNADLAADIQELLTDIPDALSDLDEDSTHRTVTDAEKAVWNAKSDFSGLYDDLIDKPPLDYIPIAQKGTANGVAELDANGRVLSSQLPSYVDDTIEGTLLSEDVFKDAFDQEVIGESGKIYVDTTTNKTYRWSGSRYVEISASLALGEVSETAYRGDRGKIAYDHSQTTSGNPHGVTKSDIGLSNVEDKSSSTIRSEITKENVTTALGYTPLDETEIESTTTQDSDVSHIKTVPGNSAHYAKILKVGGMSYASENLIPFPYKDGDAIVSGNTVNGVTWTVNSDGGVSAVGTATGYTGLYIGKVLVETGKQYTASLFGSYSNIVMEVTFYNENDAFVRGYEVVSADRSVTINPNDVSGATYFTLIVKRAANDEACMGTVYPMLNEGTTAKPYSLYFEGLRHAKPTAIKSVGANILPETSMERGYWEISGTVVSKVNHNTDLIRAGDRIPVLPNTTYCVSSTNQSLSWAVWYVDENYNALGRTDSWISADVATFTTPSVPCYALFCGWYQAGDYQNDIMINVGTSPKSYTPYVGTLGTLPIPSAVQDLPDYGLGVSATVNNHVDWSERKYHKTCGEVALGLFDWLFGGYYAYPNVANNFAKPEGACVANVPNDITSYNINGSGIPVFIFPEGAYANADAVKAAMQGVTLVYELATPDVTDISDILTKDGLLQVEANDYVEIVTDNGLAAASTIEFHENVTEVFAADTLVGDLVGTAARALADSEGNTFAKVATSGNYNDLSNKPNIPNVPNITEDDIDYWNGGVESAASAYSLATTANNTANAAKSSADSKLPTSGGTLSGHLNLTERKNILLRPGNEHYTSGIGYDTAGNECVSLWAKNSVTRLRWNAGIDMTDMAPGTMMYITPDFEISKETGTTYGYIAGKKIVTDTIILENDVDLNTIITSGFYRTSSSPLNGPETFSGAWSQLIVCRGADTVTQIISDYSSGQLATRAGNPPEVGGNGSWTSWRTIVDGDNIGAQHVAYATGASQDSYGNVIYDTYLRKSGDTMAGRLQVNAPIFGYQYSQNTNSAAFIFDKPGAYYTGIGSHDEADTIYFGPVNGQADPTWVPGFKQKWKFQGSLIADSVGGVDGALVDFTSVDGNSVIDLSADYVGYNGNQIATINQIPSRASDVGAISTAGGQITGALYLPVSSGTHLSNYYISAGGGFSPNSGKYGVKVVCCDQPDCQTGLGQDLTGLNGGYELSIAGGRGTEGVGYISFAMHDVDSTDYTRLGYFDASGNFYASGNIYANGQQLTPGGGASADQYAAEMALMHTTLAKLAFSQKLTTPMNRSFYWEESGISCTIWFDGFLYSYTVWENDMEENYAEDYWNVRFEVDYLNHSITAYPISSGEPGYDPYKFNIDVNSSFPVSLIVYKP